MHSIAKRAVSRDLAIGMYNLFLADTANDIIKPVFILETLALEAFGISWVVKGETLLGDEPAD